MPWFFSPQAQNLLKGLFKRNPQKRLGAGHNGAQQIRNHNFFANIYWDKLLTRQVVPPFKPTFSASAELTHYFDVEFTKKTPRGLISFSF